MNVSQLRALHGLQHFRSPVPMSEAAEFTLPPALNKMNELLPEGCQLRIRR